jgi:hypothetical protein
MRIADNDRAIVDRRADGATHEPASSMTRAEIASAVSVHGRGMAIAAIASRPSPGVETHTAER